MKKCPFRADDIQDAAIKCPHFGSSLLAERSSPTAASRVKIIDAVERTVITAENHPLESGDSTPAIVTPRDVFPPAVPQGLVTAVIVGSPTNAPEIDLSWSFNLETDLAGYRVYRSEQQDTPGQLLTPDLLLSPAYRDTSVQPGHRYWYSVTSVDRTGNESLPTAPVAAEITQPSS